MRYENSLQHWGIKGMKWGVRRYQNKDGTLTEAGKKRYSRDIQENKSKKKDSRIDTSNPDPRRWAREDLERTGRVIDATSKIVRQAQDVERSTVPKSTKKRLDLSNMTDKELQDRINREMLERRYNDLFAPEETPTVSKGRTAARDILETAGTVLGVAGSAVSLALAISQLRGK